MEASSPLASMRAPSFMPTWGHNEIYNPHSHTHHFSSNLFGPGAFNFRDNSTKRTSTSDCFQSKETRGTSPTASLAADLSQNFHIDMSPQLPTPRRSLFTSNLFGAIGFRESVTTPPLQPSSPATLHDIMDISPLPHKQPHFSHIDSPTPGISPTNKAASPKRSSHLEPPRPTNCLERKKTHSARLSLSKTRGCSSSSLGYCLTDNQVPQFNFGAGRSKLSTSTSVSLEECFLDSPPHERRVSSAPSPTSSHNVPPRLGKAFGSMNPGTRLTGSPLGNCSRRSSKLTIRPRKQYRRSLSMFEHPGDVEKSKPNDAVVSNLHLVMDIDEIHQPILPHFFQEGNPDSIPRINLDTLVKILDGDYKSHYEKSMIVDCRFEYEFEGGHIDGAVNFNDKDLLAAELFDTPSPGQTLLIFHCEYSAHRAPIMARHIRKQDRSANDENYPKLTYPEIYILDGGYSAFYAQHRNRCFPQNYVEMDDKEHAYTCEREMGRLRQNRAKFSRAQTYAFGQAQLEESPTAPTKCRNTIRNDMAISGVTSPVPCGRRLVSY
ncbi:M-phase inducer phosphatase [Podosphaera aphanis]|nr:M-phase inducer phosphatase [Podosphaera aphanis]